MTHLRYHSLNLSLIALETMRLLVQIPFLGKVGQKKKNCQFKLEFGPYTNSNMQNPIVVFTFSVLDRKYPFRTNLVQKIKIISLSWKLVPKLIRICRNHWWIHFSVFHQIYPLWANLVRTIITAILFGQIWCKQSELLF